MKLLQCLSCGRWHEVDKGVERVWCSVDTEGVPLAVSHESRAVGLRPMTLTSDEVQELTKRLDQPDAPPKRRPRHADKLEKIEARFREHEAVYEIDGTYSPQASMDLNWLIGEVRRLRHHLEGRS